MKPPKFFQFFHKYKEILLPIGIFLISLIVYLSYGMKANLRKDNSIIIYAGQQMANGVPYYVSIFDIKSPLAYILAGVGVIIARLIGWNDIITVRLLFLLVSCVTVVSIYFLIKYLFDSSEVGVLSALLFLCFFGFSYYSAFGPRAKILMLLFEILSIWATARRKWFWGAFIGSIAFLTWQPMLIFPVLTICLAFIQSTQKERIVALLTSMTGFLIPLVITSLYFLSYSYNAFESFLYGTLLFYLLYADRDPTDSFLKGIRKNLENPFFAIIEGFSAMMFLIILGFVMIILLFFLVRSKYPSFKEMIREDPFIVIFGSLLVLVVFAFIDFQRFPDFLMFLPYISIGCAKFFENLLPYFKTCIENHHQDIYGLKRLNSDHLYTIMILGLAISMVFSAELMAYHERDFYDDRYTSTLAYQQEQAAEILNIFGENISILCLGNPELFVILNRTNPSRFLFIFMGLDNYIHAVTPGGFEGWIQEIEEINPDLIAYGSTRITHHTRKLFNWIEINYTPTKIGPWLLFVRNELFYCPSRNVLFVGKIPTRT
ncbi:MAG: DolP-mannose mannosyltransferase [Candidatus Heimdallarchaeota archaeon]|nr:MAG: DolP-mannose mannosyltransferase [Candidatus Heimdallarchaeota archaeon]